MVNYTLINYTDTTVANVNAGLVDIPKRCIRTGVALDATELAAAVVSGLVVVKDAPTRAKLRAAAKVMQYRNKSTAGAAL